MRIFSKDQWGRSLSAKKLLARGALVGEVLTRYYCFCTERVCDLTGKKANNKMIVTFSHKRIHKLQQPNLFMKRLWWEKKGKFVRMKLSASAIKSVDKHGLEEMAKKAGLDLNDYISG